MISYLLSDQGSNPSRDHRRAGGLYAGNCREKIIERSWTISSKAETEREESLTILLHNKKKTPKRGENESSYIGRGDRGQRLSLS